MNASLSVLHLDSSALGEASVSRQLSAAIAAVYAPAATALVHRDLSATPLPHWTPAEAGSAQSQTVLEEFLAADVIIIGVPMYNFGIPSALKAWIDRIAVAGKTFRYTEQGPEGLVGGKRIILASSRGGMYGDTHPMEFQEQYLRGVFGFLGIAADHIDVVRAEGIALGETAKTQAIRQALAQVPPTRVHPEALAA